MIKKTILIILFLNYIYANAQTIKGKVIDETKSPVSYATASLVSPIDSAIIKSVLTNIEGEFSLNISSQNPSLQIAHIGYKTVTLPIIDTNYKEITIISDTSLLQDVTVVSTPPIISLRGGSLVVNIKNTTISNIGTAGKLLKRIPGIQTGIDGIEVHGKGKPLIYINNRLIRNLAELEQLPSQDIESVEVSLNPGAEYDASVGSVIKIKTIKKQGDGLSGNFLLGAVNAEEWQHRETINLNYRKRNFDFFASLDNFKAYFEGYNNQEISLISDTLRELKQKQNATQNGYSVDTKIGASYNTDKTSLGLSYNLGFSPIKLNIGDGTIEQILQVNQALREKLSSNYSLNLSNQSHRINTYYSYKTSNKLVIDFNYDYFRGRDIFNRNTFENSTLVNSHSHSQYNLHIEKLVLSYPLFEGEWKIGEEGSISHVKNIYSNDRLSNINNIGKDKEWKIGLFTTYSKKIKKVSVQGGIRYESLKFENISANSETGNVSETYNSFFPSLSISLPVGKTNLSFNYNSKIQRPSFSLLNSNVEYVNRFMFRQGNPHLRPQYIHDITTNFIYRNIFGSLSYQYTKNFIIDTIGLYEDRQDALIRSYSNTPQKQHLNFTFSYSPKIKAWEPSFNLYVSQQFLKIHYNESLKYFNKPTINFTANNEISLPKNFGISLDFGIRSAGNVGLQYRESDWNIDLNFRKSLLNNALTLYGGVLDIFKSQRSYYTMYGSNFNIKNQRALNTRMFQFAIIYQFNRTYSKYKGGGSSEYSERIKKELQF